MNMKFGILAVLVFVWGPMGALADDFAVCYQTGGSYRFTLSATPDDHPKLRVDISGPILVNYLPAVEVSYEKGKIPGPIKYYDSKGESIKSHVNLDAALFSSPDHKVQLAIAVDTIDSTGEKALIGQAFQTLVTEKQMKKEFMQGFHSGISVYCVPFFNTTDLKVAIKAIEDILAK